MLTLLAQVLRPRFTEPREAAWCRGHGHAGFVFWDFGFGRTAARENDPRIRKSPTSRSPPARLRPRAGRGPTSAATPRGPGDDGDAIRLRPLAHQAGKASANRRDEIHEKTTRTGRVGARQNPDALAEANASAGVP